jgi:hypothetical protein
VGAEVTPVDNSEEELALAGGPPEGALIADAGALTGAELRLLVCSSAEEW